MQSKLKNWAIIAYIILGLEGFINASYLAIERFMGGTIKCVIFSGCETVNNSAYAQVFGIPLSFFGALFYLLVFLLSVRYLQIKNVKILHILHWLALLALLFSAYLFVIQAFVINAYCFYCIVSACTALSLFIIGFWLPKDSFFMRK